MSVYRYDRPTVDHVAIGVKNIKESIKFYNGVLGLPILKILGPKDNPNIVFVEGIELMQRKEGTASPGPSAYLHVGLAAMNIEEVVRDLEKKGIKFTSPLREVKFKEENVAVKVASFQDLDGITVELVEWRKL